MMAASSSGHPAISKYRRTERSIILAKRWEVPTGGPMTDLRMLCANQPCTPIIATRRIPVYPAFRFPSTSNLRGMELSCSKCRCGAAAPLFDGSSVSIGSVSRFRLSWATLRGAVPVSAVRSAAYSRAKRPSRGGHERGGLSNVSSKLGRIRLRGARPRMWRRDAANAMCCPNAIKPTRCPAAQGQHRLHARGNRSSGAAQGW